MTTENNVCTKEHILIFSNSKKYSSYQDLLKEHPHIYLLRNPNWVGGQMWIVNKNQRIYLNNYECPHCKNIFLIQNIENISQCASKQIEFAIQDARILIIDSVHNGYNPLEIESIMGLLLARTKEN